MRPNYVVPTSPKFSSADVFCEAAAAAAVVWASFLHQFLCFARRHLCDSKTHTLYLPMNTYASLHLTLTLSSVQGMHNTQRMFFFEASNLVFRQTPWLAHFRKVYVFTFLFGSLTSHI